MPNSLSDTKSYIEPFCRYMPSNVGANNMPLIGIANIVRNIILAAPFTWAFNRNNDDSITTVQGTQDYATSITDFGFLEKTTVKDTDGKLWELEDVLNNISLGKSTTQARPEAIAVEGFAPTPIVPTLLGTIKTSFTSSDFTGKSTFSFTVPQPVIEGDTLVFGLELSNGAGNPTSVTDSLGNVITLISSQTVPQTPGTDSVATELGAAAAYSILAAAGISNTGSTIIAGGNIGSFPTATETGFTPANFIPPAVIDNTHASAALSAALTAYNFYSALSFTSLSGSSANLSVLGNGATASTYVPGNYSAGSSMDIPTSITLDAQGNPNAMFVFKAGSTLTLESGASILLANGAQAENVVWIVGSSATTVGTAGVFNGNILANTSITIGGGTFNGRALAGIVTSSGAVVIATAASMAVQSIGPGPVDDHQFLVYNMPVTVSGTSTITITAPASTGTSLSLTQVSVSGTTVSYTGTITGGASNAFAGQTFTMSGFTNPGNNVSMLITGSTATSLVGTTTTQVNELHSETAAFSLALTQVAVVGPTVTYTGTITGGAANAYVGQTFLISGFTISGNNVSFLVTSSTATTLVGTTTTQANETHAAAAALTVPLSQVSVSGTTVTYTGTIAGGISNGLAGQLFVISGFTNSGNNVSFTATSSTATTLVGTTTTQVNESHVQTATSPLTARNFLVEGVLLTAVGPIQITSPVNDQGTGTTWASQSLTTALPNEVLVSFTAGYAPPTSVTAPFSMIQSGIIPDSTLANVQLSTAVLMAVTPGAYTSNWSQSPSSPWQTVLVGYPSLPGLGNLSPTFRFSAVPNKAYPVDLIYQKKPVQFVFLSDSWAPIPDSFSDVYNNLCLGYYMESCQDPRAPQYIARGIAGLLSRSQGLTQMDKALFAASYLNFSAQQMLEMMKPQQSVQAQASR